MKPFKSSYKNINETKIPKYKIAKSEISKTLEQNEIRQSRNCNVESLKSERVQSKNEITETIKLEKSNINLPINSSKIPKKYSGIHATKNFISKNSALTPKSVKKITTKSQNSIIKFYTSEIDKTKESYNDISHDINKSFKIIQENEKCKSNFSDNQHSDISNDEIRQRYRSEYIGNPSLPVNQKFLENSELIEEKLKPKPNIKKINDRHSYNNSEQNKATNLDRNNIPLITKNNRNKKELTSIRLSLNPKTNNLPRDKNNDTNLEMKLTNKINKRNPSVNTSIKDKELVELPFDEKRSKSENCYFFRSKISDVSPKDIISFIKAKQDDLPSFNSAKTAIKKYGIVEAFVVNTHTGAVRVYNEDRVSIILNAQNKFAKLKGSKSNLNCSMFSVFDGHGGTSCCNYLKERLHSELLENLDIEGLIIPSIKKVYEKIDEDYNKHAREFKHNFSGSCANTLIIINNSLIVSNTGDSRSIFSHRNGSRVTQASSDHKPDKLSEFSRIIENGGELYKMSSNIKTGQSNMHFVKNYSQLKKINEIQKNSQNMIFGPWRVKPGGLSVSRSFGDLEAKRSLANNLRRIVISEPDITEFDLEDIDFVFIACKLNSRWSL